MSSNPGKCVTIYQFSELFAKAWRQAMTPSNIVSGFRVTGAYPVNRYTIVLPGERAQPAGTSTSCLAKKKGIKYMPFYSPSCEQKKSEETIRFTEEEDKKYQSRYEEGYDLDIDARYNLWLKLFHPSSESPSLKLFTSDDTPSHSSLPLSLSSTPQQAPLSPAEPCSQRSGSKIKAYRFLSIPAPPRKKGSKSTGARILTSVEYMKAMDEKQKHKKEEAEQREKRRVEREKKRQERVMLAKNKKAKAAVKNL